jgi:RHS repeat-associated protein
LNRIRTDSTRLRGATAWSSVGSHWQSSYTYDGNGNIQTLYRANATGSQMDNLTYAYTSGTNKLINISDYQGASTGADIGNQGGNNYAYDATGNMTQDTAAGIEAGGIVWSPYNKIKSITKMGDDTTSKLVYHYDATGNRILKRYYKPYNTLKSTTWYVRDAQGNTLATYTKPADSSTARQHEVMLYGSTRLAVAETQAPYSDSETDTLGIFDRVSSRTLGTKRYELTDHLGNVRATVTDVVIDHSGDLDAELSTRTDYYPFGMIMGGRNSSADDAHRYGFNGKENDNEVKGEGVQQDYGFRIYDSRVARFLSVDPLAAGYPSWSPYPFAMNRVIDAIDLDGLEAVPYTDPMQAIWDGFGQAVIYASDVLDRVVSQVNTFVGLRVQTKLPGTPTSIYAGVKLTVAAKQQTGNYLRSLRSAGPGKTTSSSPVTITTSVDFAVGQHTSIKLGPLFLEKYDEWTSKDGYNSSTTAGVKVPLRPGVDAVVQGSSRSNGNEDVTVKVKAGGKASNVSASTTTSQSGSGETTQTTTVKVELESAKVGFDAGAEVITKVKEQEDK